MARFCLDFTLVEAAVAAHMAVHCRGKRRVQLQDGYITTTSSESDGVQEIEELDTIKMLADTKTSKNIDALLVAKYI